MTSNYILDDTYKIYWYIEGVRYKPHFKKIKHIW